MVHQVIRVIQHVVLWHLIGLFLLKGRLLLSMIHLKFFIKVVLYVLDLAITLPLRAHVMILLLLDDTSELGSGVFGYNLSAVGVVRDQKHPWIACSSGSTPKHEKDVRI